MKHVMIAVASILLALGAAGCVPSPSTRCYEFEHEVQAMFDRCGVMHTFHVVDPTTRMPSCGRVTHLVAIDEVIHVCYPWLRSVDCTTIDPTDPLATFPPECAGTHFESPPP